MQAANKAFALHSFNELAVMETILVKPKLEGICSDSSRLVGFNLGPSGEILFLEALNALDREIVQAGWATFFKSKPEASQSYLLSAYSFEGEKIHSINIHEEPFNITEVQPTQDGYLLVCPRCYRHSSSDIEKNGRVYDASGHLVREIVLGDGIEQVFVSKDHNVWVSYFDEGIFGNYGWDSPLGRAGLVEWSLDGIKHYEFEPSDGLEYMADCYSLNIDLNEDVWCYYYTEFPIVRIKDRAIADYWESPVQGASRFSVSFPYVLFVGGYADKGLFQLVMLHQDRKANIIRKFHLEDKQGAIIDPEQIAVRGENMAVFSGGRVYVSKLSEFIRNGS